MFPPSVAIVAVVLVPAAEPAVRVEALKDGYRVTLTRAAAERFRGALDTTDEKSLADTLKQMAKDERAKDEESERAARLDVIAVVLSGQIPQLRKAMQENVGPNGATIRVGGVQ